MNKFAGKRVVVFGGGDSSSRLDNDVRTDCGQSYNCSLP